MPMAALSPTGTTAAPFAAIARWWRNWRQAQANRAELDRCGIDETRTIARDVGVTVPDLYGLAEHRPEDAQLLPRRMAALDLDPSQVARSAPVALRDLQRLCTMCQSKGRCARDLASDPASGEWRDYCPNVTTFDALQAEKAAKTQAGGSSAA
jgi:hypothetical protein